MKEMSRSLNSHKEIATFGQQESLVRISPVALDTQVVSLLIGTPTANEKK